MKALTYALLTGFVAVLAANAQDDQPAPFGLGWYVAPNPGSSPNYQGAIPNIPPGYPSVTGGTSAIAEALTPEISALARDLQNDPTQIYNYVHDRIRYVHYFGAAKGATLTLLDGSGNDFDQCALLVALLTAAGYTNYSYQFGMVDVPYNALNQQDYQHWIGTTLPDTNSTSDINLVDTINAEFGFPVTYYRISGSGEAVSIFQHLWVQLTVSGTNYALDPSFKVNQATAGRGLSSVAGINTNTLLTDASGTSTANYVQSLNENTVRNDLTTYTENVLNYLQTNSPNASVLQFYGGQTITPTAGQPLPQTMVPVPDTDGGYWPQSSWQFIPTNLMAVLIVTIPGTSNLTNIFYIPGLAGSRLTLVCATNGVAQLWQDDTEISSVQTTGESSPTFQPVVTIQHPFGTNWNFATGGFLPQRFAGFDQSITNTYVRTNATYNLVYGFDAGQGWLTYRERKLDAYRQQGLADNSRQVVSETLNLLGLNWMAQDEQVMQICASDTTNISSLLAFDGRVAQETNGGYYVDMHLVLGYQSSVTTSFSPLEVQVTGYFYSALERAVIEQTQNTNLNAASTVEWLELASTNGQKIFMATSNNWSTVEPSISNYAPYLSTFTNLIRAGAVLLLPANGSNEVAGAGSYTGSGYVYLLPYEGYSEGFYIFGNYNGGYSGSKTATVSPSTVAAQDGNQPPYFNPQSATSGAQTGTAADPVSMVDGSFQITSDDLALGGIEPRGLNLTRYYSSGRRNANLAGMAPGWLHSYYCTASVESAWQPAFGSTTPQSTAAMMVAMQSAIEVMNPSQPSAKNWMVTALIAKWGIDQVIKNAVSINLGNQTIQFIAQPNGSYLPQANCNMSLLLTNGSYWLQERRGRTFQFSTNTSLLTNIVDQYGQAMKFSYSSNNLLTNITDWKNRTLAFAYSSGKLASVADSAGRSVSYGYTGADLTSYTDPDGNEFTYAYDTNHQLLATYDALGNLVVTNTYDVDGHIASQLTLGATNRLWQIFASGAQTTVLDPAGGKRVYFFDAKSRQVGFQDGLGNLTQTSYDGQDHVTNTVSPLAETNQFIYDGNNNLIETIDPLGFSNVFTFDGNNNLISSTDGRNNTSHFGYNSQFSPTGSTNGNGDYFALAYNTDGTLQSRTDSGGTTTYGYDSDGTLNSITYPGSLGSESFANDPMGDKTNHTDARSFSTSLAYNKRRLLTNSIAPTNVTVSMTIDSNANLSTITDARLNLTSNNWSTTRKLLSTVYPSTPQGNPIVTNGYDNRDWLAVRRDPLGNYAYVTNDADHRLIASTDPLQRATIFGYDNDGRRATTRDAAGDVVTQTWNARGNLVKVVDAATNIVGKTFDAAGNLVYLTNRNGKLWTFQYDGANRLTNTSSPLGHSSGQVYNNRGLVQSSADPLNNLTTFGYDARGRLNSLTNSVRTNNYQYDGNNNLLVVTNLGTGQQSSWAYDAYNRPVVCTNAQGFVIQYRYDANGNLTNLIYPGNLTVKYFYDSNNRLTNVTDWASRQTTLTYDLAGHLTNVSRPNNTIRSMAYDADGELTNIIEQAASHYPIGFFTLNYNAAGRVQWEFKGPLPHSNSVPTRTMTYDNDNRLATFNGTNVTMDNDGRLTYGPGTNGTFVTYSYDTASELTSADGVGYAYDPQGNRIAMTNGATVTTYVVSPQGAQVLMRMTGTATNYYIYGAGLMYEIDVSGAATTTAFYHSDSRGSTVALTDANGNPTDVIEYSAYGTTTFRYGTNSTPFLYNGQFGVQTDPNGLLYMRARYYNPYICRFISPDPSGFNGGLNYYAFCNGNPVSEEDPFGLDTQISIGISGVIGGSPFLMPPAGFVGGGVNLGITTGGQVFIQFQGTGMGGGGLYAGVGVQGGVTTSPSATPSGWSADTTMHVEGDAGWGPSVGVSTDSGESSTGAGFPLPNLDIGLGYGAMAGVGATSSATWATGNVMGAVAGYLNTPDYAYSPPMTYYNSPPSTLPVSANASTQGISSDNISNSAENSSTGK